MKFLMITTFYPPYNFGGDGIYIYRLCNELGRRGHQVDIVHCTDAYRILEKGGPKGEYGNHENIRIFRIKSPLGPFSPFITQQTGRSFFKRQIIQDLVSKNNYDVIHYHNMSLIGLEALNYGNAIKLYHLHEHWLVCPMHVLWKYNREACTTQNCITCQLYGKRPLQWWRYTGYMRQQLSKVDLFLSPSLFTKNKHHELGLDIPIKHLPYFLPSSAKPSSSEMAKSPIHPEAERPFFLFVGRLEKIKGLQNIFPVFKTFDKCDLLIAGDGTYEKSLRKAASGITNVHFLGRMSYDKLQSLYQQALAVIVPSICYEVFGIIIIESFSHKTPVIVNNLGALPEVISQSGGGFIYNSRQELVSQMEKLMEHPELRTKLGERGYEAYQKYWTERYHIERYFGYIKEVARSRNIKNTNINSLSA